MKLASQVDSLRVELHKERSERFELPALSSLFLSFDFFLSRFQEKLELSQENDFSQQKISTLESIVSSLEEQISSLSSSIAANEENTSYHHDNMNRSAVSFASASASSSHHQQRQDQRREKQPSSSLSVQRRSIDNSSILTAGTISQRVKGEQQRVAPKESFNRSHLSAINKNLPVLSASLSLAAPTPPIVSLDISSMEVSSSSLNHRNIRSQSTSRYLTRIERKQQQQQVLSSPFVEAAPSLPSHRESRYCSPSPRQQASHRKEKDGGGRRSTAVIPSSPNILRTNEITMKKRMKELAGIETVNSTSPPSSIAPSEGDGEEERGRYHYHADSEKNHQQHQHPHHHLLSHYRSQEPHEYSSSFYDKIPPLSSSDPSNRGGDVVATTVNDDNVSLIVNGLENMLKELKGEKKKGQQHHQQSTRAYSSFYHHTSSSSPSSSPLPLRRSPSSKSHSQSAPPSPKSSEKPLSPKQSSRKEMERRSLSPSLLRSKSASDDLFSSSSLRPVSSSVHAPSPSMTKKTGTEEDNESFSSFHQYLHQHDHHLSQQQHSPQHQHRQQHVRRSSPSPSPPPPPSPHPSSSPSFSSPPKKEYHHNHHHPQQEKRKETRSSATSPIRMMEEHERTSRRTSSASFTTGREREGRNVATSPIPYFNIIDCDNGRDNCNNRERTDRTSASASPSRRSQPYLPPQPLHSLQLVHEIELQYSLINPSATEEERERMRRAAEEERNRLRSRSESFSSSSFHAGRNREKERTGSPSLAVPALSSSPRSSSHSLSPGRDRRKNLSEGEEKEKEAFSSKTIHYHSKQFIVPNYVVSSSLSSYEVIPPLLPTLASLTSPGKRKPENHKKESFCSLSAFEDVISQYNRIVSEFNSLLSSFKEEKSEYLQLQDDYREEIQQSVSLIHSLKQQLSEALFNQETMKMEKESYQTQLMEKMKELRYATSLTARGREREKQSRSPSKPGVRGRENVIERERQNVSSPSPSSRSPFNRSVSPSLRMEYLPPLATVPRPSSSSSPVKATFISTSPITTRPPIRSSSPLRASSSSSSRAASPVRLPTSSSSICLSPQNREENQSIPLSMAKILIDVGEQTEDSRSDRERERKEEITLLYPEITFPINLSDFSFLSSTSSARPLSPTKSPSGKKGSSAGEEKEKKKKTVETVLQSLDSLLYYSKTELSRIEIAISSQLLASASSPSLGGRRGSGRNGLSSPSSSSSSIVPPSSLSSCKVMIPLSNLQDFISSLLEIKLFLEISWKSLSQEKLSLSSEKNSFELKNSYLLEILNEKQRLITELQDSLSLLQANNSSNEKKASLTIEQLTKQLDTLTKELNLNLPTIPLSYSLSPPNRQERESLNYNNRNKDKEKDEKSPLQSPSPSKVVFFSCFIHFTPYCFLSFLLTSFSLF
jgi:hypothetical protein